MCGASYCARNLGGVASCSNLATRACGGAGPADELAHMNGARGSGEWGDLGVESEASEASEFERTIPREFRRPDRPWPACAAPSTREEARVVSFAALSLCHRSRREPTAPRHARCSSFAGGSSATSAAPACQRSGGESSRVTAWRLLRFREAAVPLVRAMDRRRGTGRRTVRGRSTASRFAGEPPGEAGL